MRCVAVLVGGEGAMQAAAVVVVEAVVGLGGMRAGARADEVKPPTSMQVSGW